MTARPLPAPKRDDGLQSGLAEISCQATIKLTKFSRNNNNKKVTKISYPFRKKK